MDKNTKAQVAEMVLEGAIGMTIGTTIQKKVLPECSAMEGIVVCLGTTALGWFVGRKFAKEFYKFSDENFGTDILENYQI